MMHCVVRVFASQAGLALCTLLAVSGCSLKSASEGATLSLVVPNPKTFSQLVGPPVGVAPSAWNDTSTIKCYGINVVGLGIADTSSNPSLNPSLGELFTPGGKACAYRGIVGGPFQFSGNAEVVIDLQVPSGAGRVIQLIGITNSSYCDSRFLENDPNSTGPGAYELGRVTADLFGDSTVSIPITYTAANSLNSRVDCGSASAATVLSVAFDAGMGGSFVNSTNTATFSLSGTCSVSGNPVDVKVAGTTVASPVCSIGGTWSTANDFTAHPDGSLTLTAVHSDGNGNTITSTPITLVKDTTPPAIPSGLSNLTPGTSPGMISTPAIQVSGLTIGDNVKLYADGACTSALATGTAAGTTLSLTSSALSDGTHTFRARVFDAAGNGSSCASSPTVVYVYDSIAPTVAVTSPAPNAYVNAANVTAFTVSGTCSESTRNVVFSGAASGLIACAGGTWSTSLDFSAASGGNITLLIDHSDAAGNSATQASLALIKDTTAPTVAITSPAGGSYVNNANKAALVVSGTCSESTQNVVLGGDASAVIACTAGAWSTTLDLSAVADGPVNFTADHSDVAGNTATQATLSLSKDTLNPTVAISNPAAATYVNSSNVSGFVVNGSCSENGANVVISGSASATVTCTSSIWTASLDFTAAGQGSVTINVDQSDAAGNTAAVASRSFIKDTVAPTVSITAPVGGEVFTPNQGVSITWTASDSVALATNPITLEYTPDGTNFTIIASNVSNSGSYAWTIPALPGNNTMRVKVVATDAAGNVAASGSANPFAILGPPSKLMFGPVTAQAPQSLNAESCYGPLQVQAQDVNGYPSPVTTAVTLTLSGSGIVSFHKMSNCGDAAVTSDGIALNTHSLATPLFYRATNIGAGNIMASGGSLTSATRSISSTASGSWTSLTVSSPRYGHSAIWTGTEMIVWGGNAPSTVTNSGFRTNGSTSTTISPTGAPTARENHSAIWTGTEMIVWGGMSGASLSTGGRYDPTANTWTATTGTLAPPARYNHSAVWTGAVAGGKMLIWGGRSAAATPLAAGAIYDPLGNAWTAMSSTAAPLPRVGHVALWTGSKMLIWGGSNDAGTFFNDGALYDPILDSWTPITSSGAPSARSDTSAVWTGTELIVWSGNASSYQMTDGARYNPTSDTWTPISSIGAPWVRGNAGAVWTGLKMVIFGGFGPSYPTFGGAYDPSTDTWEAVTNLGAPTTPGGLPSMVYTGSQIFYYGGNGNNQATLFKLMGF